MSVHPREDDQRPPPIVAVLANGLRRLMGKSQFTCRLRRVAPTVQLKRYSRFLEGRTRTKIVVDGVATCKSRLCPLCVGKWERTRASEITQAIEQWGAYRTVFVTYTMQHRRGMALALMHRILSHASGAMWSGRRGQAAARQLGGRPETCRAHDLTWSDENGWHPHLHCLLFLQGRRDDLGAVHELLTKRWTEQLESTLYTLKNSLMKIRLRVPCEWDCADCKAGRECPVLRDRCAKLFGTKLIRAKNPRGEETKLIDEASRVLRVLACFTAENIRPSFQRAVHVERVQDEKGIGHYLAKLGAMGFELAASSSKRGSGEGGDDWGLGHYGSDRRIRHYGLWEVARVCTIHGHPLRGAAKRAWQELYTATFGTQTITFSDREELGLGPDEYPNEGECPNDLEPPELPDGEFSSVLGTIVGSTWDDLAKQQGHGLLVMIEHADRLGLLEHLPHVSPPVTERAGIPSSRGPPTPGPRPPTQAEREAVSLEHFRRGRAFWADVRAQLAARDVPRDWVFMEEVREKLWRENASTEPLRPKAPKV